MENFVLPEIGFNWVIPFLFVISVIVFIHEMGHFLVARWCNVKVDVFSIGFGPQLFSWTDRKETKWRVALLPLGGYVKFAGDANGASMPDADTISQMSEEEKKTSFPLKPLWQKSAIVAAGPMANFILSIVIFSMFFYFIGAQDILPRIASVVPEGAAERAGIKEGDIITSINGQDVKGFSQVKRLIMLSGGDEVLVDLDRAGESIQVAMSPEQQVIPDQFGNKQTNWLIGVRIASNKQDIFHQSYDLLPSIAAGFTETWQIIKDTIKFIGQLFTGRQSTDQLSGPIGIANMAGQLGLTSLIYMIAVLSVSIGLINLFPIPILDGGHLLFYFIEAIRGRPLSEGVQEFSFKTGFFLIILLMIFVFHIDLLKVFSG